MHFRFQFNKHQHTLSVYTLQSPPFHISSSAACIERLCVVVRFTYHFFAEEHLILFHRNVLLLLSRDIITCVLELYHNTTSAITHWLTDFDSAIITLYDYEERPTNRWRWNLSNFEITLTSDFTKKLPRCTLFHWMATVGRHNNTVYKDEHRTVRNANLLINKNPGQLYTVDQVGQVTILWMTGHR